MGKTDVLAFAYREFHELGFRCARSGGKMKKHTPAASIRIRRFDLHRATERPLVFTLAGTIPVPPPPANGNARTGRNIDPEVASGVTITRSARLSRRRCGQGGGEPLPSRRRLHSTPRVSRRSPQRVRACRAARSVLSPWLASTAASIPLPSSRTHNRNCASS